MTVRAKFRCNSVEHYSDGPQEQKRYTASGEEPATHLVWPRTFRFTAVYDPQVPEDQRYALATPSGELILRVDNPAADFEVGRQYYLDFTPAG